MTVLGHPFIEVYSGEKSNTKQWNIKQWNLFSDEATGMILATSWKSELLCLVELQQPIRGWMWQEHWWKERSWFYAFFKSKWRIEKILNTECKFRRLSEGFLCILYVEGQVWSKASWLRWRWGIYQGKQHDSGKFSKTSSISHLWMNHRKISRRLNISTLVYICVTKSNQGLDVAVSNYEVGKRDKPFLTKNWRWRKYCWKRMK